MAVIVAHVGLLVKYYHSCPHDFMSNTKRAWSDVPDHVIVRMANTEHGMDLGEAADLHEQLGKAILEALKVKPKPIKTRESRAHARIFPTEP